MKVCVPIGFPQEGWLNCEFQTFPNTQTREDVALVNRKVNDFIWIKFKEIKTYPFFTRFYHTVKSGQAGFVYLTF